MIYLLAWPITLIGVALISLVGQWALAIVAPGILVMTLWAADLHGRDPQARERSASRPFGLRPWQVTWYRVVLGIELPRAWRTLEGDQQGVYNPQRSAAQAPLKSRSKR